MIDPKKISLSAKGTFAPAAITSIPAAAMRSTWFCVINLEAAQGINTSAFKSQILAFTSSNESQTLEKYLWSYSGGSGTIQQEINQQIINYVYIESPIDYEISVSFISGEIWDTILIDVLIDGEKIAGYMMAP